MSVDVHPRLDEAVTQAVASVAAARLETPAALFLLATGDDRFARSLEGGAIVNLAEVDGVPETWRSSALHVGRINDTPLWCLEDAPDEAAAAEGPAWARAFPVWWAAACGAQALVYASAGTSLAESGATGLTHVTDHINLSGSTPLMGLGDSRLGPLFPDQTTVHDERLAALAGELAEVQGVSLTGAVAACVQGPAISTPAELRWQRDAGADVSVQSLAPPIIAAAHAGLPTLALCAITDSAPGPGDLASLVEATAAIAPDLDRLLLGVARELHRIDTR